MAASGLVQTAVLCALLGLAVSFPGGAPNTPATCTSLSPEHSTYAQTSPSQYTIEFGANVTSYSSGPITVYVSAGYKGIMLQARVADGSTTPVGTFTSYPTYTKLIECSSQGDTVTQSGTEVKDAAPYMWSPPDQDVGLIKFVATIANSKSTYWEGVESDVLPYNLDDIPVIARPTDTTEESNATEVTTVMTEVTTEVMTDITTMGGDGGVSDCAKCKPVKVLFGLIILIALIHA